MVRIGTLVAHRTLDGIARIGAVDGNSVRLDLFDSPAKPVAESHWLRICKDIQRVKLSIQTRVFWQDPENLNWCAGRVVGGGPDEYFVRPPNSKYDVKIADADIRVRWDRPLTDPLSVLLTSAQESPYFRDARIPALVDFAAQRAACASATAILSSRIQIHSHQINAALKILADPVQRYLLADEVGLGKTIEAGLVIRQRFLDKPKSRIAVIAPEPLRVQWQSELRERFFIDDFPVGELLIGSHATPERWRKYHGFDLAVVDEAHLLVSDDSDKSLYGTLAELARSVPRLLLLSATPVLRRESTHLALLHLLDPAVFRLDQIESFRQKLAVRQELASSLYSLSPDFPFLLQSAIDQIRALLPNDPRFDALSNEMLGLLNENGDLADESTETDLAGKIAAVRGHVAEAYRLHRRVIRNRRAKVTNEPLDDDGYVAPFEVTGRQRPKLVQLRSSEHTVAQEVVESWQTSARDAVLDGEADEKKCASVLAVLVSRSGGPLDDLRSALEYRSASAPEADLTESERVALRAFPPLPFESVLLKELKSAIMDGTAEIADALARRIDSKMKKKVVVFSGRGTLAGSAYGELIRRHTASVYRHTKTLTSSEVEEQVKAWRAGGGLLICDESAEEGRNFQDAEAVLHLRLPTDPNALEQRIGRVDRYGNPKKIGQFVFGEPTGSSVITAWRQALLDGYQVFEHSISALQDRVDRDLDEVWRAGLMEGIDGFVNSIPGIRDGLREELKQLEQLDALEASYEINTEARDIAIAVSTFEGTHHASPLFDLAGSDQGLRFRIDQNSTGKVTISAGSREPLLGNRLLAKLKYVPQEGRTGWTDRWSALRGEGRIFRLGNPIIDGLVTIVELDDRGRASAHWRVDPTWTGEPLAYFGFDYLVEADLVAALSLLPPDGELRPVIRRRADRYLEPFIRRVWIPTDRMKAETDGRTLTWLNAPYRNNTGDRNLNADRVADLHDLFGGFQQFAAAASIAEEVGKKELVRITDLPKRCETALVRVREDLAALEAQAEVRRLASGLIYDDESADQERAITDALLNGVREPSVSLLAVTAIVRSGRPWGSNVNK